MQFKESQVISKKSEAYLELVRVLKVNAETWLNLQLKYDLWEARQHQMK
jgi:plasmid maintenance system antidote protein VapI